MKIKGKKEYLSHKKGSKLTRKQAILAKCYACMGFYSDGIADCGLPDCSLYIFHPYKEKKKARKG